MMQLCNKLKLKVMIVCTASILFIQDIDPMTLPGVDPRFFEGRV